MRAAACLAALPLLIATPALAQHAGHGAPSPAPAPDEKPSEKPAEQDPRPAPADAGGEDAMPAMDWPTELPQGPSESAPAMSGMDHGAMPGMDHGAMADDEPGDAPPPPAPSDHAADRIYDPGTMARARGLLRREHGGSTQSMVRMNLGEWQVRDGENGYRWEGEAWFGGDIDRLVLKSEGEGESGSGVETAEAQVLYSHAVSPYFDVQVGLRQDLQPGPKRTYATVGFEGVAPYWFDTQGALFLSNEGELLGRLEGSYDLRLTQRWILQPRAELNLAAQDIPEMGIGSGVSNLELGLRLRYEIKREFAPYVGVSFDRKFGGTADFARALGKDDQTTSIVFGIRAWF